MCEYCDSEKMLGASEDRFAGVDAQIKYSGLLVSSWYNSVVGVGVLHIPINYCPMCGRDLRGGANEDGHVTMPRDLAHMALCGAVRWYVGRGTVASREVADGVRELLPQLGAGTKAVMARDIRRELETYGATPGPIDDMAPWRALLGAIEGEPC